MSTQMKLNIFWYVYHIGPNSVSLSPLISKIQYYLLAKPAHDIDLPKGNDSDPNMAFPDKKPFPSFVHSNITWINPG